MGANEVTLLTLLTGGRLKRRVQHPKIEECQDYKRWYYFFRYYDDEIQPDGSVKTTRKRHICGFSRGRGKGRSMGEDTITFTRAEEIRDDFLHDLNAAPTRTEAAIQAQETKPPEPGDFKFGVLAELWRKDYVDNPKVRLATPTRLKYNDRLDTHILPRWKDARLSDLNDSKAVLDWLHKCTSWYMMIDLRNIMSGIITRAQEWNIVPRSYVNPMQWVKVGERWNVRPDRIYTPEETAMVFERLADPQLLICETCLYTGTRISEAVGLQLKHFDPEAGTIRIAQRHCRGEVDEPKTKNSKRVLALGTLTDRYKQWIAKKEIKDPNAWIFAQSDEHGGPHNGDQSKPMWDSGVRSALKLAARACKANPNDKNDPGLDFPGMGLHSFRRANITWRQGVGKASAIEASKIAGHATVSMTSDYTFVPVERQEETTRPIQERMEKAKAKVVEIRSKEAAA
jgi:integrase